MNDATPLTGFNDATPSCCRGSKTTDAREVDHTLTSTPSTQFSPFYTLLETDYDRWKSYFDMALSGLTGTVSVAEWNEQRLIEKATAIADLALQVVNKKKEIL